MNILDRYWVNAPQYQPERSDKYFRETFGAMLCDDNDNDFHVMVVYSYRKAWGGIMVVEYNFSTIGPYTMSDDNLEYDVREQIRDHARCKVSFETSSRKQL